MLYCYPRTVYFIYLGKFVFKRDYEYTYSTNVYCHHRQQAVRLYNKGKINRRIAIKENNRYCDRNTPNYIVVAKHKQVLQMNKL